MADVGVVASHTVLTPRLEVRLPVEADRERFVQLFRDERFMVSSGVLDVERAHRRFDGTLERAAELPSAKQSVIGPMPTASHLSANGNSNGSYSARRIAVQATRGRQSRIARGRRGGAHRVARVMS